MCRRYGIMIQKKNEKNLTKNHYLSVKVAKAETLGRKHCVIDISMALEQETRFCYISINSPH